LNPLLTDSAINAEGTHTINVTHVANPRRRVEQINQPIVNGVTMLNGWHGRIAFSVTVPAIDCDSLEGISVDVHTFKFTLPIAKTIVSRVEVISPEPDPPRIMCPDNSAVIPIGHVEDNRHTSCEPIPACIVLPIGNIVKIINVIIMGLAVVPIGTIGTRRSINYDARGREDFGGKTMNC
jgi:hypothetical protein